MQMINWYATDPDEGEILYQVFRFEVDPNDGGGIPYVPSGLERPWTYNPTFILTVSAGVLTIAIDPNSLASRQSIWNSIELSDVEIPSSGTRLHARILETIMIDPGDFEDPEGEGSGPVDSGMRLSALRLIDNPANPGTFLVIIPMTIPQGVIDPNTGENLSEALQRLAGSTPATETQPGLMTPAMLTKLLSMEYGANRFIHPSTHPAAMIDESTERRFVSDEWLAMIGEFFESSGGVSLASILEQLAHITWQLVLQGILDGVDNVVIDTIDSAGAVNLISGQFANGRIFI